MKAVILIIEWYREINFFHKVDPLKRPDA